MKSNRIILLILMLVTLILASIRGGTVSYTLFYIIWGAPILSGLYLLYVSISLKISQSVEKTLLAKGEKVKYVFGLKNKGILTCTWARPVFFGRLSEFRDKMPTESLSIVPARAYEVDTALRVNYRGEYNVGVEKVEIMDFFKLFKLTHTYKNPIKVQVSPIVPHFDNLVFDVDEYYENIQVMSFGQEALYPDVELRKYVSGDSARVINWKASAKSGELFSRKYVDETNAGVLLVADFSPTGLAGVERIIAEDKIIEAALGIADYLYRKNIKVNTLFFDRTARMINIRSRAELDSFYAACSNVKFDAEAGCDTLLMQSMLRGYTQIIIVTHELSKENVAVADELAAKGSRVELVYIGDKNPDEEADGSINITWISPEQEVEDVLERKN